MLKIVKGGGNEISRGDRRRQSWLLAIVSKDWYSRRLVKERMLGTLSLFSEIVANFKKLRHRELGENHGLSLHSNK